MFSIAPMIIIATWGSSLIEEQLSVRPEIPVVRIAAAPATDPRTRARLVDWRGADAYFHGVRPALRSDLVQQYGLVPVPYDRVASIVRSDQFERIEEEIARVYARLEDLAREAEPEGVARAEWGGLSDRLRRLQARQGAFIAADTERRVARIRVDGALHANALALLGRYGQPS